jgi:hypothetical protein
MHHELACSLKLRHNYYHACCRAITFAQPTTILSNRESHAGNEGQDASMLHGLAAYNKDYNAVQVIALKCSRMKLAQFHKSVVTILVTTSECN